MSSSFGDDSAYESHWPDSDSNVSDSSDDGAREFESALVDAALRNRRLLQKLSATPSALMKLLVLDAQHGGELADS